MSNGLVSAFGDGLRAAFPDQGLPVQTTTIVAAPAPAPGQTNESSFGFFPLNRLRALPDMSVMTLRLILAVVHQNYCQYILFEYPNLR